jgi:hypothetical protein
MKRSALDYLGAVRQFDVAHQERYRPRVLFRPGHVDTWCNFFAADVALAMLVPLPHWVDTDGKPVGAGQGHELNVGGMEAWLAKSGSKYGWSKCTEETARANAQAGRFTVVTAAADHIAVVVPGPERVTTIAQAGKSCFESGTLAQSFDHFTPQCVFWAAF